MPDWDASLSQSNVIEGDWLLLLLFQITKGK